MYEYSFEKKKDFWSIISVSKQIRKIPSDQKRIICVFFFFTNATERIFLANIRQCCRIKRLSLNLINHSLSTMLSIRANRGFSVFFQPYDVGVHLNHKFYALCLHRIHNSKRKTKRRGYVRNCYIKRR